MGLLTSTRSDDYAYRMYEESEIRKLEQILILRKLNISIKDIQRIFNTTGSEVVLEVLGRKVENIDDEVSLLHELKVIVLEFIHDIEQLNFADTSDVKLLYNKAKEIETQLIKTDYNGQSSNVNRLIKITEKLDKKVPDILVVKIPPFKAVTTGNQTWDDMFKQGGYMYQLWQFTHCYKTVIFDCFDFILAKGDKAEWICALNDEVTNDDVSPFEVSEFSGGLYAMAVSIDEDNESISRVEDKVRLWIDNTNFELDKSRSVLFNMPYLYEPGRDDDYMEIEKGLGYKQMQRYFPIKLKAEFK
ncbi:MerR family transcriptional regulator [Mycoplasmatota bacterium WC44]